MSNSEYDLLQTKVSKRASKILNNLAKARGTTIYGLIQLTCQFLVRMASGRHTLTDETKRLMTMFHMEPGWKDVFNATDPTAEIEVAQEILILQQKGKKGFGARMVNKPYFGEWTETECVDTIVERVIEVCMPGIYKRLRRLSEIHKYTSMSDLLITLSDAKIIDDLNEMDRKEMQEAANLNVDGRAIEYGQRTRRKKHFDVDSLPEQTRIHFTDYDRELSNDEADNGT